MKPILIKTSRGNIAYRSYGNPGNPPLMLVHGWPQSSYCWAEVAKYLTEFNVITPDLRGLGDSERSLAVEAYQKKELGKDLFARLLPFYRRTDRLEKYQRSNRRDQSSRYQRRQYRHFQ